MRVQRIATAGGIDDLKLIAENTAEVNYLKQLGAAGTLSSRSVNVGSTILFRPISSASLIIPALPLISAGAIGKMDFTLRQNQDFIVDLIFKDGAGAPIDLNDYSAIKLQFYNNRSGGPIVSLAIGSGLTISGDDNNVLTIALTPDDTLLLTADRYKHDLLMEKGNNNSYMIEGIANIERTGTR